MPRERVFNPHETETYRQYLQRLRDADPEAYTPSSLAASMLTTVMLMQHGRQRSIVQREPFFAARKNLEKSPAFKQMMKDPQAMHLLQNGDTAGLFTLLGNTEAQRQQELDRKYKRPEDREVVAKDAELLKAAIDGLKESAGNAPTTGSPEIEERGKQYKEMMKQLESARTLAENGVQLSGEQTKALFTAVKAYNDGGTRNVKPGGEKQAEGFVQSMALLKNYMPAAEFNRYCRRMNTARGLQSPEHPDYVSPEAFEPQRLTGARTAKALLAQNQRRMQVAFGAEAAAEAMAIHQLSGGDPNRLLRPEEVERQTRKLTQPGSALMKAMQDPSTRNTLRIMAEQGPEAAKDLGRTVSEEAWMRTVRTAQGEINRSIRHLADGSPLNRFYTEQYLANILASEMLAMNATGEEKITNAAFRERAEELRQDPAFRALADRFINEPQYREEMVNDLLRDRSAKGLADAYQKEKQPLRLRREQEQREQEQAQQEEVQAEQAPEQPGPEQPQQIRPGQPRPDQFRLPNV